MWDQITRISWLGALLGTVGFTALGGAWYAALFGKAYAASLGRPHDPAQKPGLLFIAGPMACSAVVAVANALLMKVFAIHGAGPAIAFGAIVGLGYLVPMTVNIAINPLFPRPFFYSLISGPYFLLGNVICCILIAIVS